MSNCPFSFYSNLKGTNELGKLNPGCFTDFVVVNQVPIKISNTI
ncbi:hypothetical protein GCM10008935_08710 [Alkalibacillus silvisoli]|uniref:Amidohydrolase-related domain-containing protein n=1 Tax=Alkalibacillus silvisoli TaxID=392823 RepID=A0ABP3JJU4_9BACI